MNEKLKYWHWWNNLVLFLNKKNLNKYLLTRQRCVRAAHPRLCEALGTPPTSLYGREAVSCGWTGHLTALSALHSAEAPETHNISRTLELVMGESNTFKNRIQRIQIHPCIRIVGYLRSVIHRCFALWRHRAVKKALFVIFKCFFYDLLPVIHRRFSSWRYQDPRPTLPSTIERIRPLLLYFLLVNLLFTEMVH